MQEADEFGGHLFKGGGVEVVGEGVVGEGEGGLVELPVAKAAGFPTGQVLFFDRLVVELFLQDGLNFRQGVEPVEEALLIFRAIEASV